MKMQILESDIKKYICGRFIIQLDNDKEDIDITKGNASFWLEKRIKFISVCCDIGGNNNVLVAGFLYSNKNSMITEDFLDYFNGTDDSDGRFCRLLTSKELEWLFVQMKERNL